MWLRVDFITLITGFLVTLYYGSKKAPYFPIEISRMLESSQEARNCFVWTLFIFAITHALRTQYFMFLEACGIVGIVVFDDKRFWTLHMFSVFALFLWISLKVPFDYLVYALCYYCMRFVYKGFALWYFENNVSFDYAMQLMLGTQQFKSEWTLIAFQTAGVLQWVAFAIMVFGAYY